ncbi:MAG: hypothetical protein GY906_33590, partial [bacterium]|nr:hypothetical protein [bacterium]
MASGSLRRRVVIVLVLIVTAIAFWRIVYPQSVPEIHGRVIDGETGEP